MINAACDILAKKPILDAIEDAKIQSTKFLKLIGDKNRERESVSYLTLGPVNSGFLVRNQFND